MPLTYEKKKQLEALLKDPDKEFSDEARERAQAAIEAFDNDFLKRGAASQEKPVGEGESDRILSVGRAVRPGEAHPDQMKVQQLVSQLDPNISLPAQILALQPGTTHPGGDDAAKDEWLRGPIDNPAGRVIFYEPPIRQTREALLANPELFRALQLSVPPTPEGVMSIQPGDSTHQLYGDYLWKQAAEAAAKGGKTAYRFSKAPYLASGPNGSWLDSLSTKLKAGALPAMEGLTAIVGGIDDSANVGLGAAASGASELDNDGPPKLTPEEEASGKYAWHPTLGKVPKEWQKETAAGGKPVGAGNDEVVGGLSSSIPDDASAGEVADAAEEEHPGKHTIGQVAGAVLPTRWGGVAGGLWDWMVGQGASQGIVRGAAAGALRHAGAGAVEQTAREGVQAASSYADTGDSGSTLGDAGGRVLGAAASSVLPGALGGGLRGLANKVTEEVRWGDAYKGAPGRVESLGVEPKIGKGHVPPKVVTEAEKRGRVEGGKRPLQVLAQDLDEPLADAANYRLSDVERVGEGNAAEHYASTEGKATLPVRSLVETAAERLRKLTSEVPRHGRVPVARGRVQGPLVDIFNANIEGVSARPTKNGVKLTAKEARSFLADNWTKKLSLDKLEEAGKHVYVTPRRYDSAHADAVIEQLGKSKDDDVAAVYEAALKDREGRSWSGEKGAWSKVQDEQGRAEAGARDTVRRIGASKPGGVRRAVVRAGKSRGQGDDIPALEEAARRAGGVAPEKLRGARVAEDLADLKSWASIGGKSPRGDGKRSLLGLTALGDMAMLRGVYPAARKLEKLPPGAAGKAARAGNVAVRNNMDSPDDERRQKRDEKNAEGYRERAKDAGAGERKRRKERKLARRRRVASSEAEQ